MFKMSSGTNVSHFFRLFLLLSCPWVPYVAMHMISIDKTVRLIICLIRCTSENVSCFERFGTSEMQINTQQQSRGASVSETVAANKKFNALLHARTRTEKNNIHHICVSTATFPTVENYIFFPFFEHDVR